MKYKLLDLENSYLNSTVVRFGMHWPTERIEATFSPTQKVFTDDILPDSLSTFIYLYNGQAAVFINKVSVNKQPIDYDPFEDSSGKMIYKASERAIGEREFTIKLDVWTADGLDSIVVINKNALLVKKCDE